VLRRPQAARLLAVVREADGTRLLLLGRDEADVGRDEGSALRVGDASVDVRHALIRYSRGGYYVVDLKSAEGTQVNGQRIRRKRRLKHGDIIRFGRAPGYKFIDADALKRRRWRRNLRVAAVVAVLAAVGIADHFERWVLFSLTTAKEIVSWVQSHAMSRPAEAPMIKVASAPTLALSPAPPPKISTPTLAARPTTLPTISAFARPTRTARPPRRATPAAIASPPLTEEAPGVASTNTNWLDVLNGYRASVNAPSVAEDPALSRGCLAHAKYLMTNYGPMMAHGRSPGALFHQEDESKPGYSPEGLKAALASDVVYQPRSNLPEAQLMAEAIQWWLSGPFHRPELVSPDLRQAGFGQYCQGTGCIAVLDTISDSTLAPPGGRPLARPIEIPPDSATVKLATFGGEWPNPVSSCPGYSQSAQAITLQLGTHVPAKLGDASLTQTRGAAAGTRVATCAYDSDSYTNPDIGGQAKGRAVLEGFGEAVMMVRDPLVAWDTYHVAMKVNGESYTWSFTVAP
jgi:uncharacterized protein YkwD